MCIIKFDGRWQLEPLLKICSHSRCRCVRTSKKLTWELSLKTMSFPATKGGSRSGMAVDPMLEVLEDAMLRWAHSTRSRQTKQEGITAVFPIAGAVPCSFSVATKDVASSTFGNDHSGAFAIAFLVKVGCGKTITGSTEEQCDLLLGQPF